MITIDKAITAVTMQLTMNDTCKTLDVEQPRGH